MSRLNEMSCVVCKDQTLLSVEEAQTLKSALHPDWAFDQTAKCITRHFTFKSFYKTIAFVNAVAWIAEYENHHPSIVIRFKACELSFTTHSLKGLSKNDFIVAAKVDQLIIKK